jgi:hypothetical protein
MSRNPIFLFIVCILCNSGCSMVVYTARNISNDISECHHDVSADIRYHREANAAWRTYEEANSNLNPSTDFAGGFKEGYACCLEAGGKSIPPTFPPRDSSRRHWDAPAVQDWYAGYSSGVTIAQMSHKYEVRQEPLQLAGPSQLPAPSQPLGNAKRLPSTSLGSDEPSPMAEKQGTPYARYPL